MMKYLLACVLAIASITASCSRPKLTCHPEHDLQDVVSGSTITISLAHLTDPSKSLYDLIIAAPLDVERIELCNSDCSAPNVQKYPARLIYYNAERRFFQFQGLARVDAGVVIALQGVNATGQVVVARKAEVARK